MKKIQIAIFVGMILGLMAGGVAAAQEQALTLSLSRDFGYGGFNGDIEGLFSMHVTGPANLARVDFYIDDSKIGEATQAPFTLQFKTDNYPLGVHSLYAIGTTTDGQELRSQAITRKFVPASAGTNTALVIVAVVIAALLLSTVFTFLTGRNRKKSTPGTSQNYPFGGGICPKCGHPIPFGLASVHLLGSKLVICPNCRKWSMLHSAPLEALRAAEAAELTGAAAQVPDVPEEDRLKKDIDDSKYQGL